MLERFAMQAQTSFIFWMEYSGGEDLVAQR